MDNHHIFRFVMKYIMLTLMTLTTLIIILFVCYPHINKNNVYETTTGDLSISIINWNEHRLLYHNIPSRQKVLNCSRPMLHLTSLLIFVSGDIHSNPGPIQNPCGICKKPVANNHRALECESCFYWVHIKCGGITPKQYEHFKYNTHLTWECPNCLLPNVTSSFFLDDPLELSNSFQSLASNDDINTSDESIQTDVNQNYNN